MDKCYTPDKQGCKVDVGMGKMSSSPANKLGKPPLTTTSGKRCAPMEQKLGGR